MADPVSPAELDGRGVLPDWRYLLGRIEARFDAGSFARAAAFIEEIAALADAADHHPCVDLRPPGVVQVALTSTETASVSGDEVSPNPPITELDVALAAEISALAERFAIAPQPLAPSRLEVAIDALDIDAVRPFWAAILGYVDEPPRDPGGTVLAIVDPLRIGPAFWFQQMDEPRPQRNRVHLDVSVPHDEADARIAAALAAGGTMLSDRRARAFWVLADPEGNEACICTWQDRD
ncbi:MAG: VOC family protein [Actinomycetota bacterium]|nr:VOC family protein [Actinomycetota bacterium]